MVNPLAPLPRRAILSAISWYQASVSPRKGFRCASAVHSGGLSCSAVVRHLVEDRGVLGAVVPTLAQFLSCGRAAHLLRTGPSAEVRGVCCCGGIPIPFRI